MSHLYLHLVTLPDPSRSLTVPGLDSFAWFLHHRALQSTYWVKPPALASISGPFDNFSACPDFLLWKFISLSSPYQHPSTTCPGILTGPALSCVQALGAQSDMGPANTGASIKTGKARSSPDHGG